MTPVNLLPPNASPLEKALAAAVQIPALPVDYRPLWNPDTCPLTLLPWLAWSLAVDDWDSGWTEAVKRARVKIALTIHQRKGTKSSVTALISALGGNVFMREWWELSPPGDPHTFEVVLTASDQDGVPPSGEYLDALVADIARVKPARSHFTFTEGAAASGAIGMLAAARVAGFVRLDFAANGAMP